MYKLSRLLWKLSILACVYTAVVTIAMYWPQSGWVVLIVGIVVVAKRRRIVNLTSHGTARWAGYSDLQRAGMLNAERGLSVGRLLGKEPGGRWSAIKGLFRARLNAKQACQHLQAAFKKKGDVGPVVRLPNAVHTAVFCPSGGGKGVSFVIPFLFWCIEACLVIDFKGENAKITAAFRQKVLKHKIVLLDLFRLVTQTPDTLNCLDFIDKNSDTAIDDCLDLAKALVIRTGEEKERHFDDAAEMFIAAVIAVVVFFGKAEDGTRSLQTVRDILSNPQKLQTSIQLMIESTVAGGMLARMGGQLTNFVDKEKSSVLTTVARHLKFLDTLAVAESTRTSSFDPSELLSGKMTIYLILPPNHMRAQSPLLRMWITTLLRALVNGGLQETKLTHFILDEAASLGHLEPIDDAVDKFRAYGIRLLFLFQSLGQLKKCFPDGQEQTLLSNTTQIFMGVNEVGLPGGAGTADFVSARLGEETIVVQSGGTSSGQSTQWSHGGNQSSRGGGTSYNGSDNWQPQARKLLQPAEVVALDRRIAITFTPGVPPVLTRVSRYYEESHEQMRPKLIHRTLAAAKVFMMAIFVFALSVGLAARATQRALELQAEHQTPYLQLDQPGVPADQSVESTRRSYVETGR